jgi:hypothetical protein
MESILLGALVGVVVAVVMAARRKGLLTGTKDELREAERAEDAARAAPHHPGSFGG